MQELLTSDEAIQISFVRASADMIYLDSESYVAIILSESFADGSRAGIVERRVLRVHESAAASGTASFSLQLT